MGIFSLKQVQKEISDLMIGLNVTIEKINDDKRLFYSSGIVTEIKAFEYIILKIMGGDGFICEAKQNFVSRDLSIQEIKYNGSDRLIYTNQKIQELYDDKNFRWLETYMEILSDTKIDPQYPDFLRNMNLINMGLRLPIMEKTRLEGEFYIQNLREINKEQKKIKCMK